MTKQEKAVLNFNSMNCNQAVFTAFGPDYGLKEDDCFTLGLSFGAGMGRQGKTCGAVTGAYLVIGLWCAKQLQNKQEQKQLAVQKVHEFNKQFQLEHGSHDCKVLLKHDLSNPNEYQLATDLGLFDTLCPKFVGSAANILEKILV